MTSDPDHHYDLIVLGSGPAGEKGAAQAAYFQKRVAVVEREAVPGGAATNTGTIPSKTLRETALFLSGFRHRQLEGLELAWKSGTVTVRDFMARERLVKAHEQARILKNLERHGVDLYRGLGAFVDPHTIAVTHADGAVTTLTGDVILIATGSRPFQPQGYRFEDQRIYDSDEILDLNEVPRTMLVVGGGVIGCEYACMFAALGVQVTVVERRDHLMNDVDREIVANLRARMESAGVLFLMGETVAEVDDSGPAIKVRLKSGTKLETHSILVSSGRMGNTDKIGLDRIGLVPDDRGQLKVNEHYQTALPHIYAAGDVIGSPALASTAMEQARSAMVYAFNLGYDKRVARVYPFGIYTIPECSMAGETEESMTKRGIPYVVGRARYIENARGQIIGDDHGILKLIVREEDMVVVGVHIIGEQATEIVHVGLSAILEASPVTLFIQTCFNYPTLTEMYKYAAYDALGARDRRRKAKVEPPPPG